MFYRSNGGCSYTEAYNMPIFLRRYYLNKIVQEINKENEASNPKNNTNNRQHIIPKMPSNPNIKSAPKPTKFQGKVK